MSTDEGMVPFLFDVTAHVHALSPLKAWFLRSVLRTLAAPVPVTRIHDLVLYQVANVAAVRIFTQFNHDVFMNTHNFQDTDNTDIILPKWIYIKDKDDRYLRSSRDLIKSDLTFHAGNPDLSNVFQVAKSAVSTYQLIDNYNHYFERIFYEGDVKPSFYSCNTNDNNPPFHIISSSDDKVYLKDDYSPSCFFSNDLNEHDAPIAHNYINETSQMQIIQASIKNEIVDIVYDVPGGKVHDVVPLIALSTSVRNDSDGDVQQTLSYAYEKWTVGTWNNSAGIEIGAKSTFKAGVPFVASADFEISISGSYSHEWGGEVGTKQTITSSTTVTVPPKKKARATIIVRNAQIDVGFTYTQRILWSNGESEDESKSGIYNNIDSWHVDVVLDNWEDV